MITIRRPCNEDALRLIQIAWVFHTHARCADHGLGMDESDVLLSVAHFDENAFCRVAEHSERGVIGCIAGITVPWYAKRNQLIAQEVWLWASGGVGEALLFAFEEWAEGQGAILLNIASPGADEKYEKATTRLYSRWGYRQAETQWFKRLEA